ncbi:MAG: radical SAM protein [Candidatus Aminicenantes bacterium]|nr:radical SAM protein [Candidatus Aminicenantes bacterium]
MTQNHQIVDLSWVDEFIRNIKPYIFVRLEDNLLIKRPNSAFKLNPTGSNILYALLNGKKIHRLLKKIGTEYQKRKEIHNFLFAIKQQLEGNLDEFIPNPAVEITPFEMNFSKLPVLSEVAVTYRCNLRCRFCYAGCNRTANPIGSSREMTSGQVKTILRKIFLQAKVPSVSFTGGEPTLLPELPKLIDYAGTLGMRVNLITNGILIDREMAKTLASCGLNSAQVSLEGVTAKTHNHIVGREGAFNKTIAAVKHLKKAGILTHTNTTITRDNAAECPKFPAFVKEEFGNDRFSMNLVIPSGSGNVNPDILVRYHEISSHLEDIIRASEQQDVEFMWYSPVPMCMFNSIAYGLGNKGCSTCDGLLSVAANGDILPCSSFADSVGNLLTDDFSYTWESQKAKNYREKYLAHPVCKECEDFSICNGACPLYWRHFGFAELTNKE